tara:strand:+ start:84 stop:236 length:153 start_codon:yes stop_codon:yes gene_type:complete
MANFKKNSMPPISIAVSISAVIKKAMHAVVSVAVILQVLLQGCEFWNSAA